MDNSGEDYQPDGTLFTGEAEAYYEHGYYGNDYYGTEYKPDYEEDSLYFYHTSFDFERIVYLYIWELLVVITTIANILVLLVLTRKSQRNATNVILIAVAVSDSLTGLSTLPTYIYAFTHYERNDLKLTEGWCEAFMICKLFVSKTFHTMSIWFTVCLVSQRFISVSWPFKAQTIFTIPKTLIMIAVLAVLSPILHLYHLLNKKALEFKCAWQLKDPCREDCAYLWMTFLFMHFIPCTLVVILTIMMICVMSKTEGRLQESHLITNQRILKRRAAQNRRISIIVVVVAIIFLIPEIPYGVFLLISVSLKHAGDELLTLEKNRAFHCAYEILLVLSFHANFWVYTVMNRKFRSGLKRTFVPCLAVLFRCLRICGIHKQIQRTPSLSSSSEIKMEAEHTTRTTTQSMSVRSQSLRSNQSDIEMKTYRTDNCRHPVSPILEEGPSQESCREMKTYQSNGLNQPANKLQEENTSQETNMEIKTYTFNNPNQTANETLDESSNSDSDIIKQTHDSKSLTEDKGNLKEDRDQTSE